MNCKNGSNSKTLTEVLFSMSECMLFVFAVLTVPLAIPIVMGANIGTSVTGIIVSITQAGDRTIFRRAFSAATVHDMFNWLTVCLLLPLEAATGYLYRLTTAIVDGSSLQGGGSKQEFLSILTKPFTERVVQVRNITLYTTNVMKWVVPGLNKSGGLRCALSPVWDRPLGVK